MPVKVYSGSVRRHQYSFLHYDIRYLYARTAVELLKNITINVDESLAWQYAQVYNTPWRDCHHTARKFAEYYPGTLYMYLLDKCLCTIRDLTKFVKDSLVSLDMVPLFKLEIQNPRMVRNEIKLCRLPISAAVADQIDVILKTGKLCKNATKQFGKYINDTFEGNLKLVCNQITDLDNMLLLTFNHIGDENLITSGEDNYLRDDQIRDLLDIVNSMVDNPYLNTFNIAQRDIYLDTVRTCTYILSALLNTFMDRTVVPERNEEMYKELIANNNVWQDVRVAFIPFVRQFTNHTLEFVLRLPLTSTCSCYCPNKPETRNAVYPYSLQERYLNLWALVNILDKSVES